MKSCPVGFITGYSKETWKFTNILQLIELADDFFDKLEFPQASTSARSFTSIQFSDVDRLDKVQVPEDFIEHRDKKGTFFLNVEYRQKFILAGHHPLD